MSNNIMINVNNKDYYVEDGQTVMQALDKIGFHIPRLCYHPKLSVRERAEFALLKLKALQIM